VAALSAPPTPPIIPLPAAAVDAEPPTPPIIPLPAAGKDAEPLTPPIIPLSPAAVDAEPPPTAGPVAPAPNGDAALLGDPREGHCFNKIPERLVERPCLRPGCYELFDALTEGSLRHFCDGKCCKALGRVREREARYHRRRQRGFRPRRRRAPPPPKPRE
jgi:hypothetical protein